MVGPVFSKIQAIVGTASNGSIVFIANGNPTDFVNVRLTDGTNFYTAQGSGGSASTNVNIVSYGGSTVTIGQQAKSNSISVTLASDQGATSVSWSNQSVFVQNASDISITTSPSVNISSYGGTTTTLGQKSMAASMPVAIASDQGAITIQGSNISIAQLPTGNVSITGQPISVNASQEGTWTTTVNIGTDSVALAKESTAQSIFSILSNTTSTVGSAVPPKAMYMGFRDNSANINFARVVGNNVNIATTSGNVLGAVAFTYVKNGSNWEPIVGIGSNGMTVTGNNLTIAQMPTTNVSITGQPINTNASQNGVWNIGTVTTITNLQNATITSMPTTNVSVTGQPLSVNASQNGAWFTTSNVSNTVTVTGSALTIAQAPTTTVTQLIPSNFVAQIDNSSWGGVSTTLGQKSMAASVPVTLASDQSAVTISGSNISIAQLPTITNNIGSYGGTATTLGRKAMASSIPVTVASDQGSFPITGNVTIGNVGPNFNLSVNLDSFGGSATTLGQKSAPNSIPVVLASGVIPSFAAVQSGTWNIATVTTVTSITNIVTTSDNIASFGGTSVTIGQKSMAASMPVTIASDQTALSVNASQSGSWFTTSNVSNTVTITGSNLTIAQMPTTNVSITAQPISMNLSAYGGTSTTIGQKAMSASIPVTLASDQNLTRMATVQILAATTFNDTVSTATSSVTNLSQYRNWALYYTLSKANAPTDVLISPQFANDSALSTWGDIGYSYLQDLRFDDTAVGSGIKEVVTGQVLDNFFRCTLLATGTTSTATFTNTLSLAAWN